MATLQEMFDRLSIQPATRAPATPNRPRISLRRLLVLAAVLPVLAWGIHELTAPKKWFKVIVVVETDWNHHDASNVEVADRLGGALRLGNWPRRRWVRDLDGLEFTLAGPGQDEKCYLVFIGYGRSRILSTINAAVEGFIRDNPDLRYGAVETEIREQPDWGPGGRETIHRWVRPHHPAAKLRLKP